MSLGVVIPCFRQETYLPRTLGAIERALEGQAWEGVIVLSDPAAVPPAELGPRWKVIAPPVAAPLTPGAARMLGFAAVAGELVLFVDADVEVDATWVSRARTRMETDAGVSGVWGRLEEWFLTPEGERMGSDDLLRVGRSERDVGYATALVLYRRDALLRAGGYETRLRSEEDFELGLRLRRSGARLLLLGMLAGRHWSAPRPSFAELGRRWRSGLCFGQGQVLRLYVGHAEFGALLRRQRLYVVVLAWWLVGLISLVTSALGGSASPLLIWGAATGAAFTVMALRKRSLKLALFSFLTWCINAAGMVVGLVRGLEPPLSAGEHV